MAADDEMMEDINTGAGTLAGEGERDVVGMRVNIHVYNMVFFIDAQAAAIELASFRGRRFAELSEDASFYKRLVEIPVSKGFRLTFQRPLPAQKVIDVFLASMSNYAKTSEKSRQAEVLEDAKQLLTTIPNLQYGDDLTVSFATDTKFVQLSLNGEPLSIVSSNAVWCGLQLVYFGPNSDFPHIKCSAISKLPDIIAAVTLQEELSTDDFMAACGTELEVFDEISASKGSNAQEFSLQGGDTFAMEAGESSIVQEGTLSFFASEAGESSIIPKASASKGTNAQQFSLAGGDTFALEAVESSIVPEGTFSLGRFPPPQSGNGSRTWKEFAGRADGREGYVIGDVAYGVMKFLRAAAKSSGVSWRP